MSRASVTFQAAFGAGYIVVVLKFLLVHARRVLALETRRPAREQGLANQFRMFDV